MSFDEIDLERIEAERKREKELKKLKDEYGSEDRRWRPLRAEIPSEIAAQLDDFRRCNARTMMGQCQWAAIRNENFCPEHSSSEHGARLRDRQLAIWKHDLQQRWAKREEFAWPNERGVFASRKQAEIMAERRERLGDQADKTPYPQEAIDSVMDSNPGHEAVFMGQIAMSYLSGEELKHAERYSEALIREKAKLVAREMAEIRREQRRELRHRERRREICPSA